MEVKLDKTWPMEVTRDQAWTVLSDVRAVASCMPGAQITEQIDPTHFKGQVRSKVGPALMVFQGEIELLALDASAMRLEMIGKGADKGGSAATMKLEARLAPGADPAEAILAGTATISVSGKLAQFGGRLIVPVADAMLAQFADNFQAAAAQVPTAPDARLAASEAPADAIEATTLQAPVPPSGTAPAKELNALALAWSIVRGWLRSLLGRPAA